jgi:hypothetical protein
MLAVFSQEGLPLGAETRALLYSPHSFPLDCIGPVDLCIHPLDDNTVITTLHCM